MVVNNGYINRYGNAFPDLKEIAFKKGELYGNLGKFVAETKHEENGFFDSSDNLTTGVYIYQTYNNPNIAYRIYKSFADSAYYHYSDDKLVYELQKRQRFIKLTDFPTGIVTLDGNIIGQEIVYYPKNKTLLEAFASKHNFDVIEIYKKVLIVLKEMYDNGILYLDNHSKNFTLNPDLKDIIIKTIDFEKSFIEFDDWTKSQNNSFFGNYCNMINKLNEIKEIENKVGKFLLTNNFDETFEQLEEKSKKLKK